MGLQDGRKLRGCTVYPMLCHQGQGPEPWDVSLSALGASSVTGVLSHSRRSLCKRNLEVVAWQ